jgi:GWxTD domain-containing protein
MLLVPFMVTSQTLAPTEPFRLLLDVSRFRGADDEHANVELYYSFPRRGLTYRADSAGFVGAADITVLVKKADSTVHADRWLVPYVLRDTSASGSGMSLVGYYPVHLSAGEYSVKILARDRNDATRIDSIQVRMGVKVFPTDKPALSDVEFASTIRQGSPGGTFYKNTLDVVPNVGGLYTESQACYYYAEAYNLLVGDNMGDYYVRANIFDAIGKEVLSREKPRKRVTESAVLVDQFPAAKFRTGTYTLVVSLLDSSRKMLNSSAKKFFVLNRQLGIDSTLLTASTGLPLSEYMSMDETELDREFQWSKWEVTSAEKDQYSELKGVEAKRKFLSDFWRKRGPGHRDEYLSRVAYANANFNSMGRDGYRTDRGRVHIVYGVPDEVERHPNEINSKPYEIWSYHNIQGGVIFVFVTRNQGRDYELVHSTHRNELHDENWDREGITR